jgi:hypothetical protein
MGFELNGADLRGPVAAIRASNHGSNPEPISSSMILSCMQIYRCKPCNRPAIARRGSGQALICRGKLWSRALALRAKRSETAQNLCHPWRVCDGTSADFEAADLFLEVRG